MDLRELFRGERADPKITPRHVLRLVGQLSDTSAFAASLRGGPEWRSWTMANSLLVANANMLYAANQQRAGKKTIKPLIKSPRKAKPRRVVRIAEVLARRQQAGLDAAHDSAQESTHSPARSLTQE